MQRNHPHVAALLVLLALTRVALAAKTVTVTVHAGQHDRIATPITILLPKALAGAKFVSLTPTDNTNSVPAQVVPDRSPQVVWVLRRPLAAGQTRTYRLTKRIPLPKIVKPTMKVEDDGKTLTVFQAGHKVLVYNEAVVPSPDPKTPYYKRSGHIHPVYSPVGHVVTDDFSPDHAHQHGIMFPWTKTTFRGKKTEFWNQKLQLGTVEHARTLATGSGDVVAHFTTELRHVALQAKGGPTAVLTETWDVRVYRREGKGGFLFDLVSRQKCATKDPLKVLKYHYGGMAIRGRRNWIGEGVGNFLTSEGHTRKDGNHTRPRWCDMYGPVGKAAAGITLMCHPSNFRFPQPVRLHPSMPYFCYAPLVLGPFDIAPGKPYVSYFRFYVHDGKPDAKVIESLWHDYADPPRVTVK